VQRGSTLNLPLALALGLLLVVLGFSIPMTGDGAAADHPVGRAELVAQVAPHQIVVRPAQPVKSSPGGFVAVFPVTGQVAEGLAQYREADAFRGESRAADRSTRPVRAPPVFAA
jgi:hypothetical protein